MNFPHGFFIDREGNIWVTDGAPKGDARGAAGFKKRPRPSDLQVHSRRQGGDAAGRGRRRRRRREALQRADRRRRRPERRHLDHRRPRRPAGWARTRTTCTARAAGTTAWCASRRTASSSRRGAAASAPRAACRCSSTIRTASRSTTRDRLYIADRGNQRIQVLDKDGNFITRWTQFGKPSAIAIDTKGNIYVADGMSDDALESGLGARHPHRRHQDRLAQGVHPGRGSDAEAPAPSSSAWTRRAASSQVRAAAWASWSMNSSDPCFRETTMTASRFVTPLGLLACLASLAVDPVGAQNPTSGAEALRKAGVLERLAGSAATPNGGPGFVVDPAWPKPLPNNWIIGDVGGLAVDGHDHIWVYHRPRALSTTDSGAQGAAGKDEKGRADQRARPSAAVRPAVRVLRPGAVGARVRQGRQPAAGVGRPGRSRLPRKEVPRAGRLHLAGARARHLRRPQRLRLRLRQRPGGATSTASIPWAPNFGNDSHVLKFRSRRHVRLPDRHGRREGPNSNDTNGGINGTPQPFWWPT